MTAAFACGDWRHSQPRALALLVCRHDASRHGRCRGGSPASRSPDTSRIVAVVNGDVISNVDVNNRTRLFALSTGLPMSPDMLDRLKPQILRQLIDERLRMQEVQRRKIVVPDKDIAEAIRQIEQRNGMAAGHACAPKLAADGVSLRTLIDQIRTQLGWTAGAAPAVGRQVAGDQCRGGRAAAAARSAQRQAGISRRRDLHSGRGPGQPGRRRALRRDSDRRIAQGRRVPSWWRRNSARRRRRCKAANWAGCSRTSSIPRWRTWCSRCRSARSATRCRCPAASPSSPCRASARSATTWAPCCRCGRPSCRSPRRSIRRRRPDQQRQTLDKARAISASVHSCDQMEDVAKADNSPRPADPGEVRLDAVNPPAFRQLLGTLPFDQASEPLVATDGIAVVMVCSREQKNLATVTRC